MEANIASFLNAFNGLSRDCLTYIEYKYNLSRFGSNTRLSPDEYERILVELPKQVMSGFDEHRNVLSDMGGLMDRIECDIDNCRSTEAMERYVVRLLEPFRALSDGTTAIYQHEGFERQREVIVAEMMKSGTVENCLHDLFVVMNRFANRLYALLIQRGFDLRSFQDDMEVWIKDGWSAFDIAPYVGGMKRAQSFISQQETRQPKRRTEAKTRTTPTRFTTNITDYDARRVFALLAAQGYISNDTQVGEWLWICGIGDNNTKEQHVVIDWLKGQNELVYFVSGMFGEDNENELWAIASHVFTINGKVQKASNFRVANSKTNIVYGKKVKLDKILKNR